eukprot:SAG31_NODE_2453_length_5662_cov_161.116442_6_plen_56_part_00
MTVLLVPLVLLWCCSTQRGCWTNLLSAVGAHRTKFSCRHMVNLNLVPHPFGLDSY